MSNTNLAYATKGAVFVGKKMTGLKTRAVRKLKGIKGAKKIIQVVKQLAKKEALALMEDKMTIYAFEPAPVNSLYHNVWYLFEPNPLFVNQGVEDAIGGSSPNRIGDSVYGMYINYRLLLTQYNDRPNIVWRLVCIKAKASFTPPTNPTINILNNVVDIINVELPAFESVIFDKIFVNQNNVDIANNRDTKKFIQFNVKINQKIDYLNAGTIPVKFTYLLYILAYDTQASIISDGLGRFSYFRAFHFKDA